MKQILIRWYIRIGAIVLLAAVFVVSCGACEVSHGANLKFREKSPIVLTLFRAVRLKPDGTVVAIGNSILDSNRNGQCNTLEWKNIVSIAASEHHTVGLKSNGTVVAVGSNREGKCDVSKWRNIIDIAATDELTVGLKSNGTLIMTGNLVGTRSLPIEEMRAWKDIAAVYAYGGIISCLKSDGTVISAYRDFTGYVVDHKWTDIVDVAVGGKHVVGLKSDGTVVASSWDDKDKAIEGVSEWKDIIAVAANGEGTIGLKSDGTLVACGYVAGVENISQDNRIFQLKNIKAVAAGGRSVLTLDNENRAGLYGNWYMEPFPVEEWRKLK